MAVLVSALRSFGGDRHRALRPGVRWDVIRGGSCRHWPPVRRSGGEATLAAKSCPTHLRCFCRARQRRATTLEPRKDGFHPRVLTTVTIRRKSRANPFLAELKLGMGRLSLETAVGRCEVHSVSEISRLGCIRLGRGGAGRGGGVR